MCVMWVSVRCVAAGVAYVTVVHVLSQIVSPTVNQ